MLSHIKGQSEFLGSANSNSGGPSKNDVWWNQRRRHQEQTQEIATNWAVESSEHKKPHLLRTRRSWIGGHLVLSEQTQSESGADNITQLCLATVKNCRHSLCRTV